PHFTPNAADAATEEGFQIPNSRFQNSDSRIVLFWNWEFGIWNSVTGKMRARRGDGTESESNRPLVAALGAGLLTPPHGRPQVSRRASQPRPPSQHVSQMVRHREQSSLPRCS